MTVRVAALAVVVAAAAGCGGSGSDRPDEGAVLLLDFTPNAVHVGIYTALARDFDGAERELVDASPLTVLPGRDALDELPAALGDAPVYVHLDLDVLEAGELPVPFPSEGGLEIAELRRLLAHVAAHREIVGFEVTSFQAPLDELERVLRATAVKRVVEPLLDALEEGAHVRH